MEEEAVIAFDRTPRPVPGMLLASVHFCGGWTQFGWAFFGFGMIFVWLFTAQSDIASLWKFAGETETADGFVVDTENTGHSVGGSEHREGSPIIRIRYRFVDHADVEHRAATYATDWSPAADTNVLVEYPAGRPDISRIQGTRRAPLDLVGLLPLLFPAIGVTNIVVAFARGRSASSLFRTGRLAAGHLVEKRRTNVQPGFPRWPLPFYAAPDGFAL